MVLKRKLQVLDGREHHYVLINLFEIKAFSYATESFPLELMQSNYFKTDAKIDFVKTLTEEEQNEYLPFPFVINELEISDFIRLKSKRIDGLINEIETLYQHEFDMVEQDVRFDGSFSDSIDVLRNTTKSWSNESDFYILTIGNFDNDNIKIHPLYHDMRFIHDYFYLIVGLSEDSNELMIVELGYE